MSDHRGLLLKFVPEVFFWLLWAGGLYRGKGAMGTATGKGAGLTNSGYADIGQAPIGPFNPNYLEF